MIMVQSTSSRRAESAATGNFVELPITPATAPPRPRGRPRKPTHKTPCTATFDAVAAAIKAIPPDERAKAGKVARPGRNAAKDRARAVVGRDARLARSDIVVFNRLLDEIRWNEGRCCHSLQWFADSCAMKRNTVTRAFKALKDAGHILRRRKKSAAGDWDFGETTLPVLAKTWEEMNAGVGPKKAEGGSQKRQGWVRENTWGGSELSPLPSEEPPERDDDGSARGRADPDAGLVRSFLNGENLDAVSASPPNGVTEEHRKTFRELADRFGRRKDAIVQCPTNRTDSDPVLDGLVRTELGAMSPDLRSHVIDAALRDAHTVWVQSNQDGSAGRGRGGLATLNRYMEKVLRSKADDFMRARKVSAAKDRTEQIVRQEDLEKRLRGFRRAGGGKKRGSSWDDIAADLGCDTSCAEVQGA
jgi:hypothetical protein